MLNKALLVATIFATACVAQEEDIMVKPQADQIHPEITPTATPPQTTTQSPTQSTTIRAFDRSKTVCDMLPEDGPCSLACDPQGLVDMYVAKGTCTSFVCQLSDGQSFLAGGCNW